MSPTGADEGRTVPAYVPWAIAVVTLVFVAMMLTPLVQELMRRLNAVQIP